MRIARLSSRLVTFFCTTLLIMSASMADSESDFFKNKQIKLIVGFPPGGDYDIGARLLGRYLGRYISGNPTIIIQNMPQAASIVAANYLYTQAPRDGTVIGSISRNFVNQALLGQMNIEADPRRFIWLGGTSFPGRVCFVGEKSPVQKIDDVFRTELIVGSNGSGNSTSILPTVFNHILGTKFKIIEGYKGTPDIAVAIERDEVQGVCSSYGQFRSNAQSTKEGRLRVLFRAEEITMPEIPDAPSIYDSVRSETQKQFMRFVFSSTEFGRPYVLPPDVPAVRVTVLQKAFADAVADPELIAEASRLNIDMAWRRPGDLEHSIAALYATPPDLIETAKKLVPNLQ